MSEDYDEFFPNRFGYAIFKTKLEEIDNKALSLALGVACKKEKIPQISLKKGFMNKVVKEINTFQDTYIYSYDGNKLIRIKRLKKETPKQVVKINRRELPVNPNAKPAAKASHVIGLICSCVQITNLSIYTIFDLKSYLLEKNNVNSLDFIDKKILIKACQYLYEDEHLLYYVTGEGSGAHLVKAENLKDWKYHTQFQVEIPATIKANNKTYEYEKFRLFIYDSFNNFSCPNGSRHDSEDVTIETINKYGALINFTAYHCKACDKFYTNVDTITNDFDLDGLPLIQLKLETSYNGFRRDKSDLALLRYNVRADGMDSFERQNLLSWALFYKILSKEEIIKILKNNINFNGKNDNFANAVDKWKEDLDFVMNYQLDRQIKIKSNDIEKIYKGKKV